MERPGSIFEAEITVFSTLLRARTRARRTCCYRAETPLKLMFRAHQSRRATRRGRRKIAQNSLREPFGKLVCQCRAENPFRTLSESLLERLWGGPGTLLDGSWALLARLGRPKIGLGASFGCPKTVPSASGRIPEKTLGAQTGPRSIFLRFGMDFRRFSKDFSSIFARAACDEGTKQNLKKESCDPHRASWPLRHAVASYCLYVFRNGLRTLRVQSFCVAYPQAHLVC